MAKRITLLARSANIRTKRKDVREASRTFSFDVAPTTDEKFTLL
jgi:hypothetical protein